MDELALRRDMEKAARAKQLLEDETLSSAFAALEADYIAAWKATSARDQDGRERAWTAITVLSGVRRHLENLIGNGAVAAAELDRLMHG